MKWEVAFHDEFEEEFDGFAEAVRDAILVRAGCWVKTEVVMVKTLNEKLSELPAARRERILSETDRLHAEYLTLQELRKAMELTQEQLAEMLDIRQATIAQTEKRKDLMISTLRSYVEAMGGKLSLTVEIPGRKSVSLVGFGDTAEQPRKKSGR